MNINVDLIRLNAFFRQNKSVDFRHARLQDKSNLNAWNTGALIPYPKILNQVLEKRVDDDIDTVCATLQNAEYPFNMLLSFNNEKFPKHLKHRGISVRDVRRLFAADMDGITDTQEYPGLSEYERDALVKGTVDATEIEIPTAGLADGCARPPPGIAAISE